MSNAELLALLLGTRTAAILAATHSGVSSLRELASTHAADHRDAGISAAALHRLEAVVEIARRFGETGWVSGTPFTGSAAVYDHYRERLACELVEYFIAVSLDNKHRKIRDVVVGQGSLTASIVHPRDVFARVIRDAAAAVVFVHNHPSGDPTPSREDVDITRRLRDVGELIGIRVLDHIIIGRGRYVSFVDDGYW
ncbi:DNA repair protein RadC [bacterium]|nr:DNA repair protein RadC [bacterium]